MENSLEYKINKFKEGYLIKLRENINIFEDFICCINDINVETLYSEVHKISGTAGMYGLKELSEFSTEFELYLIDVKKEILEVDKNDLKTKLIQYVEKIKNISAP